MRRRAQFAPVDGNSVLGARPNGQQPSGHAAPAVVSSGLLYEHRRLFSALVVAAVVAIAAALLVLLVLPTTSPASPAKRQQAPVSVVHKPAVAPITGAYPQSYAGTLPPYNPPNNIAPSPNFLDYCSSTSYDDSGACVYVSSLAIDGARAQEGLAPIELPTDWWWLTPSQQLFVVTNLERTVRGLPPMSAMDDSLDNEAALAAAENQDPVPSPILDWSRWGSNWAAGVGNPLETMYLWMYDDGVGSANIDCTAGNTSGCWLHRDNVLMELSCGTCIMGAAMNPTAWSGAPSWTEILMSSYNSDSVDYSWNWVLPNLPGAPGGAGLLSPAVNMAATPDGGGYWLVDSGGGVFAFGDARFYGSLAGTWLAAPIVGIAPTPDGRGYWLVGSDGGVFTFGDAAFYGSAGAIHLNQPVVGMAATPDGHGYWLVASDGGIFTYGDAGFYGSTGNIRLNKPVVGMAATASGGGYWLVASDGGIFTFGNAPFYGSTGDMVLNKPVVGMSATPNGGGYWLVASDGGIFTFGNAPFHGSTGDMVLNAPVIAMSTRSWSGYWLGAADGGIFSMGLPFDGSMG